MGSGLVLRFLVTEMFCRFDETETYPSGGMAIGKGGAGVVKWAA